jgi:hypothetical protein
MSEPEPPRLGLEKISKVTLAELVRRVSEIDNSYRDVAEKMGQLYMFADANKAIAMTRRLDQPMKNAAQNERAFAAILDELQVLAQRSGQHR